MSVISGAWVQLSKKYWPWKLYHLAVADAVAIQRPTKYKFVREFLGDRLGTVVDVGCGPGVFVRHLSSRASFLVETDVDQRSLGRVSSRHSDLRNVSFLSSSAMTLPFAAGTVDTVLFLEVLEHLRDDRGAVREIGRVMRPEGKLVLSVPVPPGEIDEESEWGHKREGYQLDDIVSLLSENGFEVEKFAFAEFKFSRAASQAIRWWREVTKLPAPIFLAWVAYLDHLLSGEKVKTGSHLPATVVIQARKASGGTSSGRLQPASS
jgi:SAM-dependent methyltransferase